LASSWSAFFGVTGIDAKGFNQVQKLVIEGSAFTIVHNDLAPGEVVNFKVALKDGTKQVDVRKGGAVLATVKPVPT